MDCKKRMSGLFQLSNEEDEGEIDPAVMSPYMMLAARVAEVKKVAVAAMDLVAYEVDWLALENELYRKERRDIPHIIWLGEEVKNVWTVYAERKPYPEVQPFASWFIFR